MQTGTFFNLIAEQSRKHPDRIAIQALDRQPLSYSHLCEHIQGIAATLNSFGIGRNDRVAIVLPNGPEMATACMAVATCATCAPLNPEYKTGEFEFFLSDLDAKLLLIQSDIKTPVRDVAQAMGIPILEVNSSNNSEAGLFNLKAKMNPSSAKQAKFAQPDDIALVLHTSGTTSQPKIVPLSQRNICATVANVSQSLALEPHDICLNVMPLFHIGGLVDLLITPLAVGGSVICTPNFSVPTFTRYLDQFRPTWCQVVPTMIQEILSYTEGSSLDLIKNSSLQYIRSVAAALPTQLLKDFEHTFNIPIIEVYGMTETTALITTNPLPPNKRKLGSVGIAAGPEVKIINESGKFMQANQSGEVVVRGENVMQGYENLPETNAEAFTNSWFHTGDLGYIDEENYLFLTGRLKEIINRGGEKISPSEVDDVLFTHPAIAEAATFSVPHDSLGEDVAVAVVLKKGTTLTKEELISYLGTKLAYFKVPRIVFFLDQIPKTASGKLQRKALAETLNLTTSASTTLRPALVAPESPLAIMLADMWSKALKVDPIGIHDNFFDLGGDSLKAATFINELQEKWGGTVYVSAIFDAPTIAEFEKFLRQHNPKMVARLLGQLVSPSHSTPRNKINSSKILQFRQAIAKTASCQKTSKHKNPTAIFILCPPRSGSTLLRVMMGGHSKLFSPPELYLLSFNTLADREAWFSGSHKFHLEGNIRSMMQLKHLDAEQAQTMMTELEQQKTPVQQYYKMMQDWLGNQILVDKTPYYGASIETLEHAEMYFKDAVYIHLLRHPYGMIRSFEEVKMEQLWYPRLVGEDYARQNPCPYNSSELAEMIWVIINQNILKFLEHIPQHRQHCLKFEDLVHNPEKAMMNMCDFLNLKLDPLMLKPQQDKQKRMTDGIHSVSRMIGDVKFHKHKDISSSPADLWKSHYSFDFLSDEAWQVASLLGYKETIAEVKDRQEFEI